MGRAGTGDTVILHQELAYADVLPVAFQPLPAPLDTVRAGSIAERNLRLRELQKMNRAAQQLVARMEGKGLARWLQLSLFGPEEMVTTIADE